MNWPHIITLTVRALMLPYLAFAGYQSLVGIWGALVGVYQHFTNHQEEA